MDNFELITEEGVQKLMDELKHLKDVERPIIIKAVADGRAHGDLKENADYQTARDRQNYIEAKIRQLEELSSKVRVVQKKIGSDIVHFGATVELLDCSTDKPMNVTIVGEYESDFKAGKISYKSPLGKELMQKTVDDFITVEAPSGKREYQILKIK